MSESDIDGDPVFDVPRNFDDSEEEQKPEPVALPKSKKPSVIEKLRTFSEKIIFENTTVSNQEKASFFVEIFENGTQKLHNENPFNSEPKSKIQEKHTCSICFDDIDPEKLIVFLCSEDKKPSTHSVCTDCYECFIDSKLSDNTAKFGCVSTECDIDFSIQIDILKKIFDAEIAEKVLNKRRGEMNLQNPNSRSCPTPDCEFTTVKNSLTLKMIHCPVCDKHFCGECRSTWEGNHSRGFNRCFQTNSGVVFQSRTKKKLDLKDISIRKTFFDFKKWSQDEGRAKIAQEFYKLRLRAKVWLLVELFVFFGILQSFFAIAAGFIIFIAASWVIFCPLIGVFWIKDISNGTNYFKVALIDFILGMTFGNLCVLVNLAIFILCLTFATLSLPVLICFVFVPGVFIMHMFDCDGDANAKPCPRCSTLIQRTYGCNHMTCEICKYDFCYECLSEWSRCGAYYNHLMNKTVLYTFQDGWKFWDPTKLMNSRGYNTFPARQKGVLQVSVFLMSPIIVAIGVILALPFTCERLAKYVATELNEPKTIALKMKAKGGLVMMGGLAVYSMAIMVVYPIVVVAWLLGSAVFLAGTALDVLIDVIFWLLKKLWHVFEMVFGLCICEKNGLNDIEVA